MLRYAGYAYDTESGLYYCSSRYYDPATRQWTTADSAKADGEESAYQYCGGNPATQIDQTGRHPENVIYVTANYNLPSGTNDYDITLIWWYIEEAHSTQPQEDWVTIWVEWKDSKSVWHIGAGPHSWSDVPGFESEVPLNDDEDFWPVDYRWHLNSTPPAGDKKTGPRTKIVITGYCEDYDRNYLGSWNFSFLLPTR